MGVTTSRGSKWLALWAVTVAAALWIGRSSARPEALDQPPAPRASRAAPPVIVAPAGQGLAAAEVRAIVHDELARQLAELRPPPAQASEPSQEPRPMSAALVAQADEAAGLIDRAIGAGRWTLDDRKQFARVSVELPPQVQVELQRKLHVAINRGAVATADGGPPFGAPVLAP